MMAKGTTATLALLLALASGQATAAAARPLQLGYAAPSPRAAGVEHLRTAPSADAPLRRAPGLRAGPRAGAGADGGLHPAPRLQALREQALNSVLAASAPGLEDERPQGALRLKFEKRGNAFRDLNRSYRDMCNRVSQKIWDEPNGKRVRFDVAGKPGVGVEIPLGRRQNR